MASKRTSWKRWLDRKPKKAMRFYRPCLEVLEDRTIPAVAGSLDAFFGVGGAAYSQLGTGSAQSYGIYRDPAGLIYTVGFANNGSNGDDIALVRYNADGSRDLSFGNQGQVLTTIAPANGGDYAEDVTGALVGGQLRIVVTGRVWNGTDYDMVVIRYNTDGSLDTTFGGTGFVTTGFPTSQDDAAYRVAFDETTGTTLVAGTSRFGSRDDFVLVRYNLDGTLDATFGNLGVVDAQFGLSDSLSGLAIDSLGRIVVGGTSQTASGNDFVVARFGTDGVLDTTFGTGGFTTVNVGSTPSNDIASSLRIDGLGRIIVGGTVRNGATTDFGLIALTSAGVLDGSFGVGGRVVAPVFANQDDVLNDIVIDSFNRIVAVGTTHVGTTPNSRFNTVVARFTVSGAFDNEFGTGGVTQTQLNGDFVDNRDDAQAVTVDGANNVLVAGHTLFNGFDVFDVLRYVGTAGPAGPNLVANPDSYTVLSGQTLDLVASGFVGILANDTLDTNAAVTAIATGTVSNGFFSGLNSSGGFTYRSDPGFVGTVTLTYFLTDSGGATSSPTTIAINVLGLGNNAPVLVAGSSPLATVAEDAGVSPGAIVSGLVPATVYSEFDAGDARGIAITFADVTNGLWQFSTDGGGSWIDFPTIGAGQGLHLFETSLIRFLPNADYNGDATIQYSGWDQSNATATLTDGIVADIVATGGITAYSSTVRAGVVTITEANDAPLAGSLILAGIPEDSPEQTFSFATLLTNVSPGPANEGSQTLTILSLANVVGGTAIISGTDVLFTPAPDYYGPAGFDFLVADDGTTAGASDPLTVMATVSFFVSEQNEPPTANPDVLPDIAATAGSITIESFELTANDVAGPGPEAGDQTLLVTAVSNAVGGTVSIVVFDGFSTITFTPDPAYFGPAGFTYTVLDDGTTDDVPDSMTATGTVTFNILGSSDLGVSVAPSVNLTLVGDNAFFVVTVVNNGAQPVDSVVVSGNLSGPGSVVSATGSASIAGNSVTWLFGTLNPGQTASVQVVSSADSTGSLSFSAFVTGNTADPEPTNNETFASLLVGDLTASPLAVPENSGSGVVVGSFQSSDGFSSPLTLSLVVGFGDNSAFTLDSSDPFNPQLIAAQSFDFEAGATRTIQIQGTASDGTVTMRTFIVTIVDVNEATTAGDDFVSGLEDQPLVISSSPLLANDFDEDFDALTIVEVGIASNGTVSLINGEITYQPFLEFNGADSFTYTVSDGRGGVATSLVTVNVAAANDPPTAFVDFLPTLFEDAGATTIAASALTGNDSAGPANEAGQTLTVAAVSGAIGGTVALSRGNVVFTPTANYNGPAGFTYTVRDNGTTAGAPDPQTSTATAFFTIQQVNDPPTVGNDFLTSTVEDSGPRTIAQASLLANDLPGPPDEASQTLTFVSVGQAFGGTVAIVGSNVIFTPAPDYFGLAGFAYVVRDNDIRDESLQPQASVFRVQFFVTEVNDAPAAKDQALSPFNADFGPIFIPWASLLQGASGGPANEAFQNLFGTGAFNAVGGTAVAVAGGVIFTAAPGYEGPASFVFQIADDGTTNGLGDSKSATATAQFNVTLSKTPPAAVSPGTTSTSGTFRKFDADLLAVNNGSLPSDSLYATSSTDDFREFGKSIRLVYAPLAALPVPIRAWGNLDARLAVVAQIVQTAPEFRPASHAFGLADSISGAPEAPRRGRLLQIVTSQFDGEDNVWIIEGLLRDQRLGAAPTANRPANVPQPPANPAPPAPPGDQSSWLAPVGGFGVGIMLCMGFLANLAFQPFADRDVFPVPPRRGGKKQN